MSHESGDGEVASAEAAGGEVASGESGDEQRADATRPRVPAQREATPPRDAGTQRDAEPQRDGLSERDLSVLAVERRGWTSPGMKERAIREQLEMSPTRYYQLLNALLDDPRALAHDPVTVNRLRRRREAQRARR